MKKRLMNVGNLMRASILLFSFLMLFVLSGADSRAGGSERGGFWYGEHLLGAGSSLELEETFSVAEEVINVGSSWEKLNDELLGIGLRYGEDVLEGMAFQTLEDLEANGVRRLDVSLELESGLGFTHMAIDSLGMLHETSREAVLLQLRGYTGFQDSRLGLNLGGSYRHGVLDTILGEDALYGANAFIDFETYRGDRFWRWSMGVEAHAAHMDMYANYYEPITETEEGVDSQTYTAAGYDLEAHFHTPALRTFTGILGYYTWRGSYGEDDEKGLLLGVRYTPLTQPVIAELNYRSGEGSNFGGILSYAVNFGRSDNTEVRSSEFDVRNYFEARVEREYTQRISRVDINETTETNQ